MKRKRVLKATKILVCVMVFCLVCISGLPVSAVVYDEDIGIAENDGVYAIINPSRYGAAAMLVEGKKDNGTSVLAARSAAVDKSDDNAYSVTVNSQKQAEAIQIWNFEPVNSESPQNPTESKGDVYYITTLVENQKQYLTIKGHDVTLEEEPSDDGNSEIAVTPGTGGYEGLYRLTNKAGMAVNLYGSDVSRGFGGWNESNVDEWQILCSAVNVRQYDTVESQSVPGTVVNLFDYWVSEQNAYDGKGSDNLETGINAQHALKFRYWDDSGIPVNAWTQSESVRQGIVAKTLKNGYPMLSGDADLGLIEENFPGISTIESLSYLFDPTEEVEIDGKTYKESHRNVSGLLQTDGDGYHYYNSRENFAEYDRNSNSFILYDESAVAPSGGGSHNYNGQFFPFNSIGDMIEANSIDAEVNHYFGLTLSTRFLQQYGGYINTSHKKSTVFEFSGDDDVWIFIDGVLVADLGGIHNTASVSIDFSSGKVNINNGSEQSTTLKKAFVAAGKYNSDEWNGDIFADNTTHTLKFFYLERGNTDSNLRLRYNLTEIPVTSLYKVDQYGENVPGAAFAIYAANDNWEYLDDNSGEYMALTEGSYTVDGDTGIITVDKGSGEKTTISPRYMDITNEDGQMIFLDEDNMPYSLKELQEIFGGDHFILREVKAPKGYRLVSDEIYLYVENNVLFCDNVYTSGVWATPTLLATATDTLYLNDGSSVQYYNLDDGTVNGTVFAVPMKYMGKEDASELQDIKNWAPIYGSDMTGYTVVDVSQYHNMVEAAIEAAQIAQQKYGNVMFSLSSSGSMQLELGNLPGDVKTYYYMLAQSGKDVTKTKYSIGYYWTSADDLSGATAENTQYIEAGATTLPDGTAYTGFARAFGGTIQVPNLINRMFVQKLNEDGELVNGAAFALYKVAEEKGKIYYIADDGTYIYLNQDEDRDKVGTATVNDVEGSYEINDENGTITVAAGDIYTISPARNTNGDTVFGITSSKKENKTGEDGTCEFVNLSDGTYYLREVAAPEDYKLNSTEIMVLVDDDTIYANAGSADDGVTVGRGPGYVVSTLAQFASEGDIDSTLTWIYAMLKVDKDYAADSFDIGDCSNWEWTADQTGSTTTNVKEEAVRTYLKYLPDNENALFNYVVNENKEEDGTLKDSMEGTKTRRLYTDEGWSYLEIYQDSYYKDYAANIGTNYTDLHDYFGEDERDISNLFSRSVYIQVTDESTNTPDTPDKPDTPDTPNIPDTPDKPDAPVTPNTPDKLDTPDHPGTPENPSSTLDKNVSEAPRTGDTNSIVPWMILLILSVVGFGGVMIVRKRKNRKA